MRVTGSSWVRFSSSHDAFAAAAALRAFAWLLIVAASTACGDSEPDRSGAAGRDRAGGDAAIGHADAAIHRFDGGAERDGSSAKPPATGVDGAAGDTGAPDGGSWHAPDATQLDGGGASALDAGLEAPDAPDVPDAAVAADAASACEPDFDLAFDTADPTRSALNPDEVFLFGTLAEGACYRDAIGHWSEPNLPLAGFDCNASIDTGYVRPTDGRLLYVDQDSASVRAFACDGCTYSHPQDLYPSSPSANDPVLPSPAYCAMNGLHAIRVSPDGHVLYSCGAGGRWYDESGGVVLEGETPLHFGLGGRLLLPTGILSLPAGERTPISGLPEGTRLAYRATAQGFWIALLPAVDAEPELWNVGPDGVATRVGSYSSPPPAAAKQIKASQLDAQGRLYQIIASTTPVLDLVIRRSIGGESEVLYDEKTQPTLRLHISSLLSGTGPSVVPAPGRVWGGEVDEPSCLEPGERGRYVAGTDPPRAALAPLATGSAGPGLSCGTGRCAAGTTCCEQLTTPDHDSVKQWKCSTAPNDFANPANTCSSFDAQSACDESADCQGAASGPGDPAVCCFARSSYRSNRVCTVASVCASASPYTGMIACQSDADCALSGPASRCVFDPALAGAQRTTVGRCDAAVRPPDGTQVLASSVLCGDSECARVNDQVCCHEGDLPIADPLAMERPRCDRSCGSSGRERYAAVSRCDEPRDCANPSKATPGDPFECCMVEAPFGDPWPRECKLRSQCRYYACKTEADCARIHPDLHCRPERTLTGGGLRRPEVRTCQSP